METITFGQCFKGAWKDAVCATRARPGVALVALALLLLVNYAQLAAAALSVPGAMPGHGRAGLIAVSALCALLKMAITFGLPVFVMRHTVLGAAIARQRKYFDRAFWRYFGLSVLFGVGVLIVIAIMVAAGVIARQGFGVSGRAFVALWMLAGIVIGLVCGFVGVRFSLLFCHAAIGGRIAWRAAWHDTRSHFWSISMTQLVTSLPLIGAVIVVIVGVFLYGRTGGNFAYAKVVGDACWTYVGTCVSAACSGWLYRRYAHRIVADA